MFLLEKRLFPVAAHSRSPIWIRGFGLGSLWSPSCGDSVEILAVARNLQSPLGVARHVHLVRHWVPAAHEHSLGLTLPVPLGTTGCPRDCHRARRVSASVCSHHHWHRRRGEEAAGSTTGLHVGRNRDVYHRGFRDGFDGPATRDAHRRDRPPEDSGGRPAGVGAFLLLYGPRTLVSIPVQGPSGYIRRLD